MKLNKLIIILILLLAVFLRFYRIDTDPPGLYIDEVSTGVNAYKILTTGQDEFGVPYPLFFRSFGDYKPPVYIYSVASVMSVLGKNELAIRFPSAAAGSLSILLFYFFIKRLVELKSNKIQPAIKKYLPATGMLLLALSSWHIHFSRGGFEVNLALFFYLLGCYLLVLFWGNNKAKYFVGGFILFALSAYTYHTFRIISPLSWLILLTAFFIKLPKLRKKIIRCGVIFIILIIPIIQFSLTSKGSERFVQTSAFSEYKADTTTQKLFVYPMVYVKNYISFFSFDYLFSNGDGNGRHQIPGFGLLYRWQLPFLILGTSWLIKQKRNAYKYVVIGLISLAPLPAALARPSPHSLRSLLLILPITILISLGIVIFYINLKKFKKIFLVFLVIIAMYDFLIYAHFYYNHYPKVNALDWGAGNKQIVEKIIKHKGKYDYLVIDKNLNFTEHYVNFYMDSVELLVVESSWVKPKEWEKKKVLYIRPNYGNVNNEQIIDRAYLPGNNNDIYAEIWNL
ncbi:MAG TPA: glycosyltransferase family 39 protein [Candidatus Limnocylindrales bacterium]|nr:glycosyltransferase family 39 protein [Candidatus Limnocylindrales bacterium]